jgi:hypothetical protein
MLMQVIEKCLSVFFIVSAKKRGDMKNGLPPALPVDQ